MRTSTLVAAAATCLCAAVQAGDPPGRSAVTAHAVRSAQRGRSAPATAGDAAATAGDAAAPTTPTQPSTSGANDGSAAQLLQEVLRAFGVDLFGAAEDGSRDASPDAPDRGDPRPGATRRGRRSTPAPPRDPVARLNRLIGEAEARLRANPRGFRSDVLVVVDYGVHSSLRRFFVVDRNTRRVQGYRVGHGADSDPLDSGYAQRFSNARDAGRPNRASSVGVFRTAETFSSAQLGYALRLDGLSDTNSNARARGLAIYAARERTRPGDPVPLSLGGPALDPEEAREVIERIKGGVLVYVPGPGEEVAPERAEAEHSARLDVSPSGGRVNYRGFTVSSAEVREALQRLAALSGRSVRVTSGDRDHVPRGGSRTSLHLAHRAADFTLTGLSLSEAFELLRSNREQVLTDGGYEVIWHQAGTSTGGPHLHLGFRGPRSETTFKTETRGVYRRVN